MNCVKKVFVCSTLAALLFLSSCEKAGDTVISIPSVSLECRSSENANCSLAANANCTGSPSQVQGFVRMTRSGCSSLQFEQIATGSASMSCDASGCSTVVSSWTDPNTSEPISEILNGSMYLCSYIDINCNVGDDSGDIENRQQIDIQNSANILIDNWSEI